MGNICTASRYHHTQRYDDIKNKSKSKTKSGSANKNCNKREVEKGRMSEKVINNRIKCVNLKSNSIVIYDEDLDDIEKELTSKITSNVEV